MNRSSWIAREGYPFIYAFLLIVLVVAAIEGSGITVLAFGLFIWCVWFFRNPEREIPADPTIAICPADGKVVDIQEIEESRFAPGRYRRVCIFMNVWHVHVNRMPVDGTVVDLRQNPGKFMVASHPKASLENEQVAYVVKTPNGETLIVNQIAGMVARRIVPFVTIGATLRRGERFGLIRFGSRVDIYMPLSWEVPLAVGQKTIAGETPLAYIRS